MGVFLWERVHMVPGHTAEYTRAFADRWLPLSDEYDRDLYRLSGYFVPDVLNTTHPAVNILWTMGTWEAWDGRWARGTPEERLIKTHEFFNPALTWRSGWTDKMIQSLPFSPTPVERPDSVRTGSLAVVHRFVVQPAACSDFVAVFEQEVVPAAHAAGLTLELFARAIGRPMEYEAFWTIPTGDAYVAWRTSADPSVAHRILPGFERAWPMLIDVEEQEMTPAWFSPIGGSQRNPRAVSEEALAI